MRPCAVILINPPVTKPCEPPPGLARIAGALKSHSITHGIIDANIEGILSLLRAAPFPPGDADRWTLRAFRRLQENIASLKSGTAFSSIDRYQRTVLDINRVLAKAIGGNGVRPTLANYIDPRLSPLRSADLLKAAEETEDNPFYPYFKQRLERLLEEEKPSIFGFSLNYLSQALCTFAMLGFLRRINPGLQLILGGGLVTTWMSRPEWHNPFSGLVDRMIAGPGEAPLLSLLGAQQKSPAYCPDYEPFCADDYLSPGFILPFSAASGCYWGRCAFCPEASEKNPYCPLPLETAIFHLQQSIAKTRPALIHLLDNALSPAFLRILADHPPGTPWYGFARFTHHLMDPDFCRALRQSGCVMLQLGLESGDQGVLDALNKGIDLREASAALRALKSAGIAPYVYLLFGTPPETTVEAHKTLDFVVQHADAVDFLNLAIFNLPAYGLNAEQMETDAFYEGDLSLYRSFKHPAGWDRPLVRQFLDKTFTRHPAVARILRRDPPLFTSNHAPLFSTPALVNGKPMP